jgi:hypothetical protein
MSRIAALTIAWAVVFAMAAEVHADGLAIGYGDDCWSSTADADRDGLTDGCEQELAYWFMPLMWFDSGESGYGRRPYFAVKSVSFAARTVQIFYMSTYFDDTGVSTGHDGDAEFQIAEVHYSAGRWYLDWMYMSAHRKSVCDSSAWYSYDQLEYDTSKPGNAFRGWPTIYVAEDKHATYNNLGTCDAGCLLQDYCSRYAYQYLDGTSGLSGRNVGSTAVPLIDQVILNGKTEYMLRDGEFTGWDNQWYRSNSQGYRRHLVDFGF